MDRNGMVRNESNQHESERQWILFGLCFHGDVRSFVHSSSERDLYIFIPNERIS